MFNYLIEIFKNRKLSLCDQFCILFLLLPYFTSDLVVVCVCVVVVVVIVVVVVVVVVVVLLLLFILQKMYQF